MNKSELIIVNLGEHSVGLQDKNGLVMLPCIYEKIPDYDDDGYIRFIKNGIYGTVDLQGNIMIGHSLELTHLGVFYGGIARARKNNKWGLVNVYGEEVTPFEYTSISAHYKNGYRAVTMDGEKVFLPEDGKKLSALNSNMFFEKLKPWTGKSLFHSLNIYYRDTDEIINTKNEYKKGKIIRAGDYFEATQKLRRPVCKTRFLIASRKLASVDEVKSFGRNIPPIPFRENIIHKNSCFLIMDVVKIAGIQQILLLHLPYGAVKLADKFKLDLSKLKAESEDGTDLRKVAIEDLQIKMTQSVYGYSLNDYWLDTMRQPLGLDSENKMVPLFPLAESDKSQNEDEIALEILIRLYSNENSMDWQEKDFLV